MLSVNVRKDALWFLDLDGTLAEWKKVKSGIHANKPMGYKNGVESDILFRRKVDFL